MNPKPRSHNDYAVGWVCALSKEQTAAIAVLDETHDDLPKPPNDHNTYILGSIGNHNIVITCLPEGKIGTSSAATAVVQMVRTFPAIKSGLMVGIGGGIPPKVRLGDVVVSKPTGQYPGVVQWDSGKAEDGGKFVRTGALNNPPTSLLTALTKLQAYHRLAGSKIPDYLEEMKKKWPRLAPKYLKSDSLEDRLFQANYSHVTESHKDEVHAVYYSDEDEEQGCQFCDKSRAINRKPREMKVHYGLIASGNQVVKDATFRDNLNRDLGGNVLCVEMEAAGLMDNFPCIVIRGICDYSDSHKNKAWQEHAAAVAAAFAKELLGYVQPSDLEGERAVKDILNSISNDVSSIKDNMTCIGSHLGRKEDLEVLNWLTPIDYGLQQTDNLKRRQRGTGQLLLNSQEYDSWVKSPKKTLFCPGMPGAGKTILTSIIIEDLESKLCNDTTAAVVYVYCNFNRKDEQSAEHLLSSLLKQLAQSQSSLPTGLQKLYDKHKKKQTRPSFDEISRCFQSVASGMSRVFIIIDALDECQTSSGCLIRFLSEVFCLQSKAEVNIFATSRFIPEIAERFQNCLCKEIRATDDDIRRYLNGHMSELPSFVARRTDLQDGIRTSIAKAASGMFLLAQLYLAALTGKDTPKAIKISLQELSTGSKTYDTAYKNTMERIEGQHQNQASRAKQVLSWITCAKRPLTTSELQHALGVETAETELDEENLPQIEYMVSVCAGLVTVDEESNIIRLVHYTTQDYFERNQGRWFPDAQLDITATCTAYLSFQAFANGYAHTDKELEQRFETHVLFDYAVHNWGYHARLAPPCGNVLSFLHQQGQVKASSQALLTEPFFKTYS